MSFKFGDLTKEEEDGFKIEVSDTRMLPYKNLFWNSITYELELSRKVYVRVVFGVLDLAKDTGGLLSALMSISWVIVAIT